MSEQPPSPETLLAVSLEITSSAERRAYLDRACAGNETLRQEVESLLAAHEQAGAFMSSEAMKATLPLPPTEKAGHRIGRYKLLEQIGEGGFGVVWMAEQEEPVRRRVALKIIKLGMDTKEVVARFEAERQALAMMDHPHIASIFDGGATNTGRPYFVMELVKGIPITTYCDANKLSTLERLALFIQVCQAVQHAHQKGIIHRDLKPSNILVTERDDRPVPKVIDFGIAKATQARLTEKTLFTRLNQWIGTPAYMSPEQASLGSLDVDTRSDVYSLGVLLYELLTGRPPFDTQKLLAQGYEAVMRTIREEEPPKPSTRLSTLNQEELGSVATKRSAEPARLNRLVRGDLDWIVMKALEKERVRRYESASAFAEDLERHLRREPVTAAPPSTLYRARRLLLRNRMAAAFTTALVLSLVSGTVLSSWQAWRASRFASEADAQRQVATSEAARALQFATEVTRSRDQVEKNAYANRILLADQLWQNGDVENAERSLDECPAPLRSWEWNYLKRKFHSEVLHIPPSHPVPNEELELRLNSDHLMFTGDGSGIWVSGLHKTAGRPQESSWEGSFFSVTDGHARSVNTNWFPGSPTADGQRMVSEAKTGAPAAMIEIASGRVLTAFQAAPGTPVALSPDEFLLASWGEDSLLLSSSTNGEVLRRISIPGGGAGLVWSPDTRWLVMLGRESNYVVEAKCGRIVLSFPSQSDDPLKGQPVAFSSNGDRIAWAGGKTDEGVECHTLSAWDLPSQRRLFERKILRAFPHIVRFAERDQIIVVASVGYNARLGDDAGDTTGEDDLSLFDASSGELKRGLRLDSHLGKGPRSVVIAAPPEFAYPSYPLYGVSSMCVSPDGNRLAAGTLDGAVHWIDIAHPEPHQVFRGHPTAIAVVALSSTPPRLASLDHSGDIRVWDCGGSALPSLKHVDKMGRFRGDGVVWDEGNGTHVVDFDRRQCLVLPGESCDRLPTPLSPDGRWFAGKGLWDIKLGVLVHTLAEPRDFLGFCSDWTRAASWAHAGATSGPLGVQLVDTVSWTNVAAPILTDWLRQDWPSSLNVALNRDGTLVAISASNSVVKVHGLRAAGPPETVCSFPGKPPFCFAPDDTWVLAGRTEGGWQQVELPSGSVRKTFASRLVFNGGVEVSRSGRHFHVWEDQTGQAEVWSTVTGELVARVAVNPYRREGSVFNPDETRMAIPGIDSLLRVWDLEQRQVLLTLPINAFDWRWSSDGNKLRVLGSDLELTEFDGSPWKPGEPKVAKTPFREVILESPKSK